MVLELHLTALFIHITVLRLWVSAQRRLQRELLKCKAWSWQLLEKVSDSGGTGRSASQTHGDLLTCASKAFP